MANQAREALSFTWSEQSDCGVRSVDSFSADGFSSVTTDEGPVFRGSYQLTGGSKVPQGGIDSLAIKERNPLGLVDKLINISSVLAMDGEANAKVVRETTAESHEIEQQNTRRPYDIDTLIELGKTTKISRRALQFSEEAPAEIISREDALISDQSNMTRRRGLSLASQVTDTSVDDNDEIMFKVKLPKSESLGIPSRQPQGPPKNTSLQLNQGFARFLKEHASPPNNRVTAGGRIVPAGPKSPPPTYQMEFIDRLIKLDEESKKINLSSDDYMAQRLKQGEAVNLKAHSRNLATNAFNHGMSSRVGKADTRNFIGNSDDNIPNTYDQRVTNSADGDYGNVSKHSDERYSLNNTRGTSGPVLQLPPESELILILGDGSAVISHQGAIVRAVLHGAHTFLEPLQQVQDICPRGLPNLQQTATAASFQPISAMHQMMHPITSLHQTPLGPQGYSQAPMAGMQYGSMPVTPNPETTFYEVQGSCAAMPMAVGSPDYQALQDYQVQMETLSTQQQTLQSHLTSLEKYIALHSQDLNPMQLSSTSAQRKSLIEQLDCIRKSKNHLEHLMQSTSQEFGNTQGPISMHKNNFQRSLTGFPQAAPIPRNFSKSTSGSRSNHEKSDRLKPLKFNENVRASIPNIQNDALKTIGNKLVNNNKLSPNAPDFVPSDGIVSAIQRSDQHGTECPNASVDSGSQGVHGSDIVSQPSQAKATKLYEPLVLPEEVSYCDEMGYNDPKAPKVYCSLVLEFVEAIKAAREHAKRYGCKGGQSKDPSWDAEQDIRWAMQDRIPIPLPLMNPDYVQRPRPWNWEDSDFNVFIHRDPSWRPARYMRQLGEPQLEPSLERWNYRIMNPRTVDQRMGSWNDGSSIIPSNVTSIHELSCVNQSNVVADPLVAGTNNSGSSSTPPTSSSRLFDENCTFNQQWSAIQRYSHKRNDSWGSSPKLSPGKCPRLGEAHEQLISQGYFPPLMSQEEAKKWGPETMAKIDERPKRCEPSVQIGAPPAVSDMPRDALVREVESNSFRDLHDESPNPLKEKWDVGRLKGKHGENIPCIAERDGSASPSPKPTNVRWSMIRRKDKDQVEINDGQTAGDPHEVSKPVFTPWSDFSRIYIASNAHSAANNNVKHELFESVKGARVKPYSEGLIPKEIKSIPVESPSDDEKSKRFLRGMLKNPEMSWSPQSKTSSSIHLESPDRNHRPSSSWNIGLKTPMRENRPLGKTNSTTQVAQEHQLSVHKSRSSVASPTFHAKGVLPRVGDPAISYLASTAKATISHTKLSPSHQSLEKDRFGSPSSRGKSGYRNTSMIGHTCGTATIGAASGHGFAFDHGRGPYQRTLLPTPRLRNDGAFVNLRALEREQIVRSTMSQQYGNRQPLGR